MDNVAVFGLGRIGLPIALVSAEKGFNVIGIDINENKVNGLRMGEEPFDEPGLKELLRRYLGVRFHPYALSENVMEVLKDTEIILITIGIDDFSRIGAPARLR